MVHIPINRIIFCLIADHKIDVAPVIRLYDVQELIDVVVLRPRVETDRVVMRLQQSALSRHRISQILRPSAEDFALLRLHGPLDRAILPVNFDLVFDFIVVFG